jgi:flagellar basal-body rod protein FlgB
MNVSGNSDALLMKLLDAATLRHGAIANNIANQNTPGYKRQVVVFEEILEEALVSGKKDLSRFAPLETTDQVTPARSDGNNVTPELEQVAEQENRMLYETYVAILQGRYSLLNTAITAGN